MKSATVNFFGSVCTMVNDRQGQRARKLVYEGSTDRGAVTIDGGARGLPPVLFAHGRNGHPADFLPLVEGLRASGIENPLCTISFGENSELAVADEAAIIAAAAQRVADFLTFGRPVRVDLVGLSKGGLSAVRAAADDAERGGAVFGRVVTVGAPLRGTAVAVWPFVGPQTAADMGPGSAACAALEARASRLALPLYHVYTPWDHIVTPPEVAVYPATPPERVYACVGKVTHIGLPADKGTIAQIAAWLKEP